MNAEDETKRPDESVRTCGGGSSRDSHSAIGGLVLPHLSSSADEFFPLAPRHLMEAGLTAGTTVEQAIPNAADSGPDRSWHATMAEHSRSNVNMIYEPCFSFLIAGRDWSV